MKQNTYLFPEKVFKKLPILVPWTNKQAYFDSAADAPGSGTEDKDFEDDLSVIHTDFDPPIPTPIPTPVQSAKNTEDTNRR